MDSSDEDEEAEKYIDDLLKSLEGIERCFMEDFADEIPRPVELESKTPFENTLKKSLSPKPVPPPKIVNLRDPRLRKRSTPLPIPPIAAIPLPDFASSIDFPTVVVPNIAVPGSEEASTKSVQTCSNALTADTMLDKQCNIAQLDLHDIDYDLVKKGLTILDTVNKMKELGQSEFVDTVSKKLKSRTEPELSRAIETPNNKSTDDPLRKIKSVVTIPSPRDPRTRTSVGSQKLKIIPAVDHRKSTSTSTVSKNTEKPRVTNHSSVVTNKCEKSMPAENLTNLDSERLTLRDLPKKLETKMCLDDRRKSTSTATVCENIPATVSKNTEKPRVTNHSSGVTNKYEKSVPAEKLKNIDSERLTSRDLPKKLETKMYHIDRRKSTSTSTICENVPTTELKSTEKSRVTNHSSGVTNKYEKSMPTAKLSNVDSERLTSRDLPKKLESETCHVVRKKSTSTSTVCEKVPATVSKSKEKPRVTNQSSSVINKCEKSVPAEKLSNVDSERLTSRDLPKKLESEKCHVDRRKSTSTSTVCEKVLATVSKSTEKLRVTNHSSVVTNKCEESVPAEKLTNVDSSKLELRDLPKKLGTETSHVDRRKSTSTSAVCENVPATVSKSTEKPRITNHSSVVSNKCEKSVPTKKLSNVDSGKLALRDLPKKLETKTCHVNGLNKSKPFDRMISCLSSELLTKVFTYLSYTDIENVKLVCKLWCDTCNVELFLKNRKLLCSGIYGTTSIMQTLSNSRCKYLNLEFNRVNFGSGLTEMWKRIGPRVHSLYLVDCFLGPETMCEVIVNCTEMTHLSISFANPKLPILEAPSLVLFKDLFRQQIKRRKLVSLDICIDTANGWWLTNNILSNLFIVYPKISQLVFIHHTLDPIPEVSDLWSETTLSFSPISHLVSSRSDSMEKLELDVHTKEPRTELAWHTIITHVRFTRLREMAIEVDLQSISGVALIEFCIAQSELESFSCKIKGCANVFMSFFLSRLLNDCPRLQSLKATNDEFLVSYEFFRKLVFSKLESLSILSTKVQFDSQITDQLEWASNEHLKSLSLSYNLGDQLQILMITIFRKLRSLQLYDSSNAVLQCIWKFQTDLVTLELSRMKFTSARGLCSPRCVRKMRNLEYLFLDIVCSQNFEKCTDYTYLELPLFRLRYLRLEISAPMKFKMRLLEAIRHSTELEGVRIFCSGINRSTWLRLNTNWKKLRYLWIIDKESVRFEYQEYLDYFIASPNLRVFIHEFKYSSETFYYDAFSKKVKNKDSTMKYRIRTEKVGSSFIDWLWF